MKIEVHVAAFVLATVLRLSTSLQPRAGFVRRAFGACGLRATRRSSRSTQVCRRSPGRCGSPSAAQALPVLVASDHSNRRLASRLSRSAPRRLTVCERRHARAVQRRASRSVGGLGAPGSVPPPPNPARDGIGITVGPGRLSGGSTTLSQKLACQKWVKRHTAASPPKAHSRPLAESNATSTSLELEASFAEHRQRPGPPVVPKASESCTNLPRTPAGC